MKLKLLIFHLFFILLLSNTAQAFELNPAKPSVLYVPSEVINESGNESFIQGVTTNNKMRLKRSVHDFVRIIEIITGVKLEISTDMPASDTPGILIGEFAEKRFGSVGKHFEYNQAFRVLVQDNTIGLWGESDLATSYAIYELLDELGCRWFFPGDEGEWLPPRGTSVAWPNRDAKLAPYTIFRSVWYADTYYYERNRLGGPFVRMNHALEFYIPKEVLAQNPAWQGTLDGKILPNRIKWSSDEAAAYIADVIIKKQRTDPQFSYSLAPDDGATFDNSPEDRALDAGDWNESMGTVSITDRLVNFTNRIVTQVVKEFPDLKFGMQAYVNYIRPPLREKLHPNLIPMLAPITYARNHSMLDPDAPGSADLKALVENWSDKAAFLAFYAYAYNLADMAAPCPFIDKWGRDVPFILKNNFLYWVPETSCTFETNGIALHLGNSLAWNPNRQVDDILQDYYRKMYGQAATDMQKYWEEVDAGWSKTREYAGSYFGFYRMFPKDRLERMRRLMNNALAKSMSDMERYRITMADESLQLFELFMKMRWDFAEGNFTHIATEMANYRKMQILLADKYEKNRAFCKHGRYTQIYFDDVLRKPYEEAAFIQQSGTRFGPLLRNWKFFYAGKTDEALTIPGFNDSDWREVDVSTETWAHLGHIHDMGAHATAYWRTKAEIPAVTIAGRRYLCLTGFEGKTRVFVNGKQVPFKPGILEVNSFCVPHSLDVTDFLREGMNDFAIETTRGWLNEVGTGGLMGPVVLYSSTVIPPSLAK